MKYEILEFEELDSEYINMDLDSELSDSIKVSFFIDWSRFVDYIQPLNYRQYSIKGIANNIDTIPISERITYIKDLKMVIPNNLTKSEYKQILKLVK